MAETVHPTAPELSKDRRRDDVSQSPPPRPNKDRLGKRLVVLTMAALLFGLTMVFGTLWLSWTLEGAAAAINDAGSLRMQSTRLALTLSQGEASRHRIPALISQVDDTLNNLSHGVPSRPLRLPSNVAAQTELVRVQGIWHDQLRPAALGFYEGSMSLARAQQAYEIALKTFVSDTNRLVGLVEQQNARDTFLLRASQFGLVALMLAGAVAIIFFLYAWVIRPIEALRQGVTEMAARNFTYRVPVESTDEIGELAMGFNDMAAQLREQYRELEDRVRVKTELYARQNKELSTLYEFSAYLSRSGDIRKKSEGFLSRVITYFGADGGSVRMLEPRTRSLRLTVHQGLSTTLVEQEECMFVNQCLCGQAAGARETRIHDFREPSHTYVIPCQQEGFGSLAVGQIRYADQQLGILTLHFQVPRRFSEEDRRLLDTLGQHFGVAIENHRLLERTKELAIAQERNLVAQGLHDSIAQGLNFLKMQVRMLRDSLDRQDQTEVNQIMPLLEVGIKESYDDVRELLTNFRMKSPEGDIVMALEAAVQRFETQTGITVQLNVDNAGPVLTPEQQLQVLFVVQEALSNVRKHAHATTVQIDLRNHEDFEIQVCDNGRGFDSRKVDFDHEQHVGLHIMQERASRLGAQLNVASGPETGTCVTLLLSKAQRVVA
ncbi:type IV pili methyl-accepting chemotaxis transducer N-terminal domain-containing protein [Orrella sp. 11846]|uniref:type IV pili methyl-accepting chemotaxis transducer N-terminal domain-containing protein n=1 Tax=Orrella sp. 11846 TaxID=3409913 RepID=UPI003B5AA86B